MAVCFFSISKYVIEFQQESARLVRKAMQSQQKVLILVGYPRICFLLKVFAGLAKYVVIFDVICNVDLVFVNPVRRK